MDRFISTIIRRGNLAVTFANGKVKRYGDATGSPIHIRFNTNTAQRQILTNPEYYLGHCYGEGSLDIIEGDMYGLLEAIYTGNPDGEFEFKPWMKALAAVRYRFRHFRENNVTTRARANVQHHYDLTGALYDLFLDSDRQYSCAYFETPDADLEQAQLAKKRHIAAKMVMSRPGLSVLDIGCGWGGMAIYLARFLGAKVKGVTLSDEQLAVAQKRAQDGGFKDKIRFELQDYRHVEEQFDRIVSVGMFEHVGRPFYDQYFQQSAKLLKKDGVMLMHTIGRTDTPTATNPFIEKYIFPGGYIPALSEVMPAIERAGLRVTDIEILRLHYAETLKAWRARFMARREEAKALYDEKFCRIWEFYLASSESAFRWQNLVIFQFQLAHDLHAVPLTRDYIQTAENCLKNIEQKQGAGATSFPHAAAE
ncbi:class I SAM-dependent methyltransferase [Rhizobium sp. KVB221]|uniref:Class I SAM-dependent methyltransferase n=2 Tax=Rhizobium setariae TaxID=2801340 RepID=A0A937CJK8_9HYPH|nr:cyclopropane-fatty-acyl-phospholipid synthase family protein [Rhizobium setariae]MBL0371210.1 class I SAM-dependent methyltransferase [Rhizobium setariae]